MIPSSREGLGTDELLAEFGPGDELVGSGRVPEDVERSVLNHLVVGPDDREGAGRDVRHLDVDDLGGGEARYAQQHEGDPEAACQTTRLPGLLHDSLLNVAPQLGSHTHKEVVARCRFGSPGRDGAGRIPLSRVSRCDNSVGSDRSGFLVLFADRSSVSLQVIMRRT